MGGTRGEMVMGGNDLLHFTLVVSDEPIRQQKNVQGITVRLGTVSVGAIGFMRIRNKYGRTLVNPNFCSADTWS